MTRAAGSSLALAALLNAFRSDDAVAVADLVDTMSSAEVERALRQACRLLVGYIEQRPGGMDLWQQVWREMDGENLA